MNWDVIEKKYYDLKEKEKNMDGFLKVIQAPIIKRETKNGIRRFAVMYGKSYLLNDIHKKDSYMYPAVLRNGKVIVEIPDEGEGGIYHVFYSEKHGKEILMSVNSKSIQFGEYDQEYTLSDVSKKTGFSIERITKYVKENNFGKKLDGEIILTTPEVMVIEEEGDS